MFNFLKPKPKTAMESYVEDVLKIEGRTAVVVAHAVELAAKLTGGAIPPRALAKHAYALHKGPIGYQNADLGVSTALFFFRDERYHDVLAPHQIAARMSLLEPIKKGHINPLVASAFEKSLYDRFSPSRSEEFSNCAIQRWPDLAVMLKNALAEFSEDTDLDVFFRDGKPGEMIASYFSQAVLDTGHMTPRKIMESAARNCKAIILDQRNFLDDEDDFGTGVHVGLIICLIVGLGTAPALELAGGIALPVTASSIFEDISSMPWGDEKQDDFHLGVFGFLGFVTNLLAPTLEQEKSKVDPSVKAMQESLKLRFAKVGLDFMQLDPVIHRAVMIEALSHGGADVAVESFQQVLQSAQHIEKTGLDPIEFLRMVHQRKLDLYEGKQN